MPLSFANLFRMVIVLTLALHVFYMYSVARAVMGGFGLDLAVMVLAMLFSFVMLVPLVWAVTLPDWTEIYTRQIRGRRWFLAGRCAACGYQLGSGDDAICSECGRAHEPPRPYTVNLRTVRTFVIINLLAWLLGSAAGETWASEDERAFVREVQARINAGKPAEHIRPRRWPVESSSLVFTPEEGLIATSRSHR